MVYRGSGKGKGSQTLTQKVDAEHLQHVERWTAGPKLLRVRRYQTHQVDAPYQLLHLDQRFPHARSLRPQAQSKVSLSHTADRP